MARTHVSAILEQTFRRLHNSSNHLHAKSHIEEVLCECEIPLDTEVLSERKGKSYESVC